jgi:hypothetical protein
VSICKDRDAVGVMCRGTATRCGLVVTKLLNSRGVRSGSLGIDQLLLHAPNAVDKSSEENL